MNRHVSPGLQVTRTIVTIALCLVPGFYVRAVAQIDVRVTQVVSAIDAGDYERAALVAQQLEQESAQDGRLLPLQSVALDLRVKALLLDGYGRSHDVLALAQRAAGRKEEAIRPGDEFRLTALLNVADSLAANGDLAGGADRIRQALSESGSHRLSDTERSALLEHLAAIEILADHTDRAAAAADEALMLRRQDPSASRIDLASTLLVNALAHQRRGEYGTSGATVREAESFLLSERTGHPLHVEALSLLSLQVWFEGDLPSAMKLSQDALELAQRTLRPDHPLLAVTLRRHGINKLLLGEGVDAYRLLTQSLSVASHAFPENHIDLWPYLNDLAEANRTLGRYTDARRLYEREHQLARAQYGERHDSVATSLHNLALVDAAIGDYGLARQEQLEATGIWERVLGPQHPFVAIALMELANVYREAGAPNLAVPLLQRALSIRQERLGPAHLDVARTWTALAATHLALRHVSEAERAIEEALSIRRRTIGPEPLDVAETYRVAGALDRARNRWGEARTWYRQSLAVLEGALGRTHPLFAELQADLAAVLAHLHEDASAIEMAAEAERSAQAHLRLTIQELSERQGLTYSASRPKAIDTLLYESTLSTTGVIAAYDAVVRGRALVMDEIISRRPSLTMSSAESAKLVEWTAARQQYANLAIKGQGEFTATQYFELMAAARSRAEALEEELAAESAPFREAHLHSRIGMTEVISNLPPDSALVSFVRYRRPSPAGRDETSYLAFVLTSDRNEPLSIELGRAERIERLVEEWRGQIAGASTPIRGDAKFLEDRTGSDLRRAIWEPIAPIVNASRRVFVVPDGVIGLVPLAALPTRNGHFLLEDAPTIHYLSTERDLVLPRLEENVGHGLLAVGGPSFNALNSVGKRPVRDARQFQPLGRGIGQADPCFDVARLWFNDLPQAKVEAESISKRWQSERQEQEGDQVALLVGASATETALKAAGPGHRVLHIATHGFFLGENCRPATRGTRSVGGLARVAPRRITSVRPNSAPSVSLVNPFLRAGLALAGANDRQRVAGDEDDGILSAAEVSNLKLDGTEWAVLSACDTGLGETTAGEIEGVLGLRRAFQMAGVHTVIMSLWAVEDTATRQWMEALYDARLSKRLPTDESVRSAALTVLHDRRARGLSTSPFYWGGFVAAGDWH